MTSKKVTPSCVHLLPHITPNWAFAEHILNVASGDTTEFSQEQLLNRYQQIVAVTSYDPDSQSEDVAKNISDIKDLHFCVVLCANVLNTKKDLTPLLSELAELNFKCCVIQIDEGNGTGKGRKSGSRHQRNELVSDYIPILQQYFPAFDVTLHRADKCITIVKGDKFLNLAHED